MSWAISVFEAWFKVHQEVEEVVLYRFFIKAQQQHGKLTLILKKQDYRIVTGIQHFLRGHGQHEVSFLPAADPTSDYVTFIAQPCYGHPACW